MNAKPDFEEKDGRRIACNTDNQDPVDALYGMLALPARTDVLLEELRGPRPKP